MSALNLWQWVMAAIVLFGVVVPGLLAAWMIWLRRPPQPRSPVAERADEPPRVVPVVLRNGL